MKRILLLLTALLAGSVSLTAADAASGSIDPQAKSDSRHDDTDMPAEYSGVVPMQELVRQGIITREQAEMIRSGAVGIAPRVQLKKKQDRVTISGFVQVYYSYIAPHDEALPNPPATNDFTTQNLILGIDASVGAGWHAVINANFAQGFAARNYLDGVYIRKFWEDIGAAYLGYKKARFGLEQYTSSRYIPAVQRSIATNYFTGSFNRIGAGTFPLSAAGVGTSRLGLGNRHVGVFWSGLVPGVDGLSYYAEVVQGFQDYAAPANTGSANQLAYYGGVQYSSHKEFGPPPPAELAYTIGINANYTPTGNSLDFLSPIGRFSKSNEIVAIDPFFHIRYEGFQAIGEFMGAMVERGRATGTNGLYSINGYNTPNAFPFGANGILSYLIDDTVEPIFRFSYINSDEAGINPNVVSNGPAFGGAVPLAGVPGAASPAISPLGVGFFDEAASYYIGLNWYILGNDVKISAGYERVQFYGRWTGAGFGGPNASEDVVRIRAQVVF